MPKALPDRELEEEKHIKTILEHDIEFSGTLKFSTSLKIKGIFNGEINATGHLYIGKNAVVKANIKVKQITVYGKIEGNVKASEKVELLNNAELIGDIRTPDLIIQSGCKFNGKCFMIQKEPSEPPLVIEQELIENESKEGKKKPQRNNFN